VNWI